VIPFFCHKMETQDNSSSKGFFLFERKGGENSSNVKCSNGKQGREGASSYILSRKAMAAFNKARVSQTYDRKNRKLLISGTDKPKQIKRYFLAFLLKASFANSE